MQNLSDAEKERLVAVRAVRDFPLISVKPLFRVRK
jgi:hypothetical protein